MKTNSFFLRILSLLVCCVGLIGCQEESQEKELATQTEISALDTLGPAPAPDSVAEKPITEADYRIEDSLAAAQTLLRFLFQEDRDYQYRLIGQEEDGYYPLIYAVLYHQGKEVDRDTMHIRYERFLKVAKLDRQVSATSFPQLDGIAIIKAYEDNHEENSEGESSESIEESSLQMLVARAGNQFIEPFFAESAYGFWYEGDDDFEFTVEERLILAGEEGGAPGQIILTHATNYNRYTWQEDGRKDTCRESYAKRRAFHLQGNAFVSRAPRPKKKPHGKDYELTVYGLPGICQGYSLGILYPGDSIQVLESSDIPSTFSENGEHYTGTWRKISYPNPDEIEQVGYIFDAPGAEEF